MTQEGRDNLGIGGRVEIERHPRNVDAQRLHSQPPLHLICR
jgi:hypothetical protein